MSGSSRLWANLDVILTAVFVVLKLTHVVDWSWWWVFAPLFVGLGIVFLTVLIGGILLAIFDHDV